jgi:hypothetical protein
MVIKRTTLVHFTPCHQFFTITLLLFLKTSTESCSITVKHSHNFKCFKLLPSVLYLLTHKNVCFRLFPSLQLNIIKSKVRTYQFKCNIPCTNLLTYLKQFTVCPKNAFILFYSNRIHILNYFSPNLQLGPAITERTVRSRVKYEGVGRQFTIDPIAYLGPERSVLLIPAYESLTQLSGSIAHP